MPKPLFVEQDPYLEPYRQILAGRLDKILLKKKELAKEKSLREFADGYHRYGLHQTPDGWLAREWAPGATGIWLTGTFNDWKIQDQYRFRKGADGNWELKLNSEDLHHLDEYKYFISWPGGGDFRLPLWAKRVIQDEVTQVFNAQVYCPPSTPPSYLPRPTAKEPLLVYEAHIGMSSEEGKVNTYFDFTQKVLPRIHKLGYNTIQLMAIQEHPYYGSFGYHVSNFFAASSRFGTPEHLKELIRTAHHLGIRVVMDIVHSHAVKNTLEGPGLYDGTTGMLFHQDQRREHPAWDSLCFDYGNNFTLYFLLSNCRYWLEEYGFDGFRFDGITSMLYLDHGLGKAFTSYHDYFNENVDEDALTYLGLANLLIHELNPYAVTIAEDMSGMPGLASKPESGGLGFNYRLSMGIPDFWIKIIKEIPDEQWIMSQIFYELTNRRIEEQTISYAESHDQALVGDKTIIFRLADRDMYTHMSKLTPSLIIDRALALHKLIRLVTLATHGGGYLNFMGNEFGHPEWIDFPRQGNNWSYHYARRQWHLAEDADLKYAGLQKFDQKMISFFSSIKFPDSEPLAFVLAQDADNVLAFQRSGYLFVFNFHPSQSYTGYGIPAEPADYTIELNTDHLDFEGFGRIDDTMLYSAEPLGKLGSGYQVRLYLPARTGIVLKRIRPAKVHRSVKLT
ncbi:MAG: alpha amylase C-terminal domain-containing protein [Bacteroidales bacterium]|nr:alpha amylase C-terminal domain-containing protein [Bacteroidales bacterium]